MSPSQHQPLMILYRTDSFGSTALPWPSHLACCELVALQHLAFLLGPTCSAPALRHPPRCMRIARLSEQSHTRFLRFYEFVALLSPGFCNGGDDSKQFLSHTPILQTITYNHQSFIA